LIYEELRHIAHRQLSNERANTLMTTDLVHEAWLRLVDAPLHSLNDRLHFFAVASRAMRQVLVDAARRRKAGKRGGISQASMPIEEAADWLSEQKSVALLALHEALEQLQVMDERMARIVELRYFGGLTIAETAKLLQISDSTVKRDWETAKVWLFSELKGIPLDL